MTKLEYLKREIRRDIEDNNLEITRELLLTLMHTNHTMKYYDQKNIKRIHILDEAIKQIYQEEFNCKIDVFTNNHIMI